MDLKLPYTTACASCGREIDLEREPDRIKNGTQTAYFECDCKNGFVKIGKSDILFIKSLKHKKVGGLFTG